MENPLKTIYAFEAGTESEMIRIRCFYKYEDLEAFIDNFYSILDENFRLNAFKSLGSAYVEKFCKKILIKVVRIHVSSDDLEFETLVLNAELDARNTLIPFDA